MNEKTFSKLEAVIISCKSWDQLMVAHRWITKVAPSLEDWSFALCIRLNNMRGYK